MKRDGRELGVHRLREGDGATIVMCHAAPGAGAFDPDPAAGVDRDLTLLAVDRPGYGGSDPAPDDRAWTVADSADDLAHVLDQLGTGPVGVAGWSAGGRVALALAARRPDLVDRVVVVATPAPDDEVPWVPAEHRAMIDAMRAMPPAQARATLAEQFTAMLPDNPADPEALQLLGASDADGDTLANPRTRDRLAAMLAAAYAQGALGMATDIVSYSVHPWGFEPAEVKAKTLLLYGARDPIAASAHGRWWQKALPQARLETVPGAGHLVVVPMWGRALSHLAPKTAR